MIEKVFCMIKHFLQVVAVHTAPNGKPETITSCKDWPWQHRLGSANSSSRQEFIWSFGPHCRTTSMWFWNTLQLQKWKGYFSEEFEKNNSLYSSGSEWNVASKFLLDEHRSDSSHDTKVYADQGIGNLSDHWSVRTPGDNDRAWRATGSGTGLHGICVLLGSRNCPKKVSWSRVWKLEDKTDLIKVYGKNMKIQTWLDDSI